MTTRLACFLFPLTFTAAAQQVEVTRYDVAEGLPQSMVNHVLQDREGFIWLGTGDGLARFDGRHFVVYKHDPRDSTSLSHNSIWGLAEKDDRHLWVGTRAGLDLLDRHTGRFQHVSTGDAHADGCWQPLHQGPERLLFYSTLLRSFLLSDGVRMERRSLHHHDSYAMRTSDNGRRVHQYLRPDSLVTMDLDNGGEQVRLLPVRPGESVLDLLELDDRWLVLTDRGGWSWNGGTERLALPPDILALLERGHGSKHLERAPDGTLWLGISGVGMVTVNADLTVRARYPLLPPDQRPLTITRIAFDRQGNTWVGTDGKGVFRIAPQRVRFGRCMPGQGLPWEPPSWFVRGFAQWDDHRVLVSFFQGGLALYDERTDRLSPLQLPPSTMAAIQGHDLRRWFRDRHGIIWVQDDLAVFAIDAVQGVPVFEVPRPWGISVVRGPDGHALLFDRRQVLRLRRSGGRWQTDTLSMPGLLAHFERNNGIPFHIGVLRDGTVLVSLTVDGISAWRNDRPMPIEGLATDVRMNAVLEGDDGRVWLCTDQGLFELDAQRLRVVGHWTIRQGLPDQFVYGMLPDGPDAWWLSTNNGLARFTPATGTFARYGMEHGLQSREFNSHAYFRSAGGRLYFGGVNGFNHFRPTGPAVDGDRPQVAVVSLTVQDSLVEFPNGRYPMHLGLPYGRNFLRIDLAVLEMSAPERNRYRYRIPGYREWTERPADRPLELTNMPDGTWAVEVMGLNADGAASEPVELLVLHVPLPFWASPWAFLLVGSLMVLLASGLGFLIYRRRVRRRMEQAEQQLTELRIRARIAQDLHDDVGSGLARITVLARSAERNARRGTLPLDDVEKVGMLSQELMDDLRDVVWVNDPRGGELADLLLRIRDHVRDLFEPCGVTCTFDLPAPLPERSVGNGFKRNLFLLFKEAAHNAFKYSGTERIELLFTLDADTFTCALTDHGSGVQHGPVKGSGHGLANMRERAEEIGARLWIGDAPGGGTTVSVSGPLSCLDH